MGSISFRAVLQHPLPPRESKVYPEWNIKSLPPSNRLVCDQLCKEIQRSIRKPLPETRYSVSFVQVPSESLQQKDV